MSPASSRPGRSGISTSSAPPRPPVPVGGDLEYADEVTLSRALGASLVLIGVVLLVVAAVLRLGFLADFLSRSALIGLLSGIGLLGMAALFYPELESLSWSDSRLQALSIAASSGSALRVSRAAAVSAWPAWQ